MKQIDEYRFQAEEGKTFVNKDTKVRFGNCIYLGDSDMIDNYSEEDMTPEELSEIAKREEEKETRNSKKKH